MRELRLTNREPLILDPGAGISNERDTLDYIPASRLRGAVFAAFQEIAPAAKPEELFGYDGPRWSCGWPADEEWKPLIPAPKCLPKQKGQVAHWFKPDGMTLKPSQPHIETNISVARHYGRRAHLHTALYARSALSPGQKFVAWVDTDKINLGTYDISLGTRHSVNGRCELVVKDSTNRLGFNSHYPTSESALLLLSDAIVPGPNGGYLRGLNGKAFTDILGCGVEVRAAYSSWHTVGAWSGQWRLPRESAIAIEAGSVWLLKISDRKTAAKRVADGIGIRKFEGFGWAEWVDVAPVPDDYAGEEAFQDVFSFFGQGADASGNPTLTCKSATETKQEAGPGAKSTHWPGLEHAGVDVLEKTLEEANSADLSSISENTLRGNLTCETSKPKIDAKEIFRLNVLLERLADKGNRE
jgi:hypothetical protein